MHTCNWRSMNIRSIHSFLPSHFSKYDVGFCSFWQCDFERFESVLNMFERCFRHVAWHVPQGLLVANQTQWMRRPYCKWRRSSHQGCWSSQASTISHYQSLSVTKYHQVSPSLPQGFCYFCCSYVFLYPDRTSTLFSQLVSHSISQSDCLMFRSSSCYFYQIAFHGHLFLSMSFPPPSLSYQNLCFTPIPPFSCSYAYFTLWLFWSNTTQLRYWHVFPKNDWCSNVFSDTFWHCIQFESCVRELSVLLRYP